SLMLSPPFLHLLLTLSLLVSYTISVDRVELKKRLNVTSFKADTEEEFTNREDYGVNVVPEDPLQRRYLGLTREAATEMVNRFIKQSIQATEGELFNV
ncbi:hypothetical protein PFISCL1PPCAC_1054, partial [Pristionchus fissidentatus]